MYYVCFAFANYFTQLLSLWFSEGKAVNILLNQTLEEFSEVNEMYSVYIVIRSEDMFVV